MELLFLGVLATMGFASWALFRRSTQTPALPSGERTLQTLQVGDVVQHLGRDYLVEGARVSLGANPGAQAELEERAHLYRLDRSTGKIVYLWHTGDADPGFLHARPNDRFDPPTDALELDGTLYHRRATRELTALRSGDIGLRRVGGHVTVRLYASGEGLLLLLLGWGDTTDAFAGKRVAAHLIDLLPGR